MESDKELKLSKNQRRKVRRYGKDTNISNLDNHKKYDTNAEFMQFIKSLVQPRNEEDHSLDELEYEKRPRHILPGSYETGKRR
jgi:hypothetical protein